ncbi:hypothetical protein EGQ50_02735 [Coxiella endosymbiont of Amblyomma sculptum]|nr:hypothetical protein EGQ50_02735 [Coxiella endosymbiont of Amblyomma sculptum]
MDWKQCDAENNHTTNLGSTFAPTYYDTSFCLLKKTVASILLFCYIEKTHCTNSLKFNCRGKIIA